MFILSTLYSVVKVPSKVPYPIKQYTRSSNNRRWGCLS